MKYTNAGSKMQAFRSIISGKTSREILRFLEFFKKLLLRQRSKFLNSILSDHTCHQRSTKLSARNELPIFCRCYYVLEFYVLPLSFKVLELFVCTTCNKFFMWIHKFLVYWYRFVFCKVSDNIFIQTFMNIPTFYFWQLKC